MGKPKIKLLDTVALVDDLPERKLKRGEVELSLRSSHQTFTKWSSLMTQARLMRNSPFAPSN